MNYRFHPKARKEVITATRYYSDIDANLGMDFRKEIEKAISSAMNHPEAWHKITSRIRRCLTNRFPYSLLYAYREKEREIFIVAVMHQRQKPGYWKSRIS